MFDEQYCLDDAMGQTLVFKNTEELPLRQLQAVGILQPNLKPWSSSLALSRAAQSEEVD